MLKKLNIGANKGLFLRPFRSYLERFGESVALRRSANPRDHERYCVLEAVLSDVRPPMQKEIRIGFQFGEFDPAMGFEGMPEVAAAIAHQLHFGFVFLVAWHEFAPIVLPSPTCLTDWNYNTDLQSLISSYI